MLNGRLLFWTAYINTGNPDRLMSVPLPGGPATTVFDTADTFSSTPTSDIVVLNGQAYFQGDGPAGDGLYRTDGTAAGTQFVVAAEVIAGLKVVNNTLFIVNGAAGAGTRLSKLEANNTLSPLTPVGANPTGPMQAVGNEVWFTAGANNPWRSNGTVAGTKEVIDVGDGYNGGIDTVVRLTNGRVIFSTTYAGTIYTTDASGVVTGPLAGTYEVTQDLLAVGNTAYFGTYDRQTSLPALYATDGTVASTRLVKLTDPAPTDKRGASSAAPRYFTALGNGKFVFSGWTSSTGYELWVSDGTAAGTTIVTDAVPGADSSLPRGNGGGSGGPNPGSRLFATGDGKVLYAADTLAHGGELWVSDGTASGTRETFDINTATRDGLTQSTSHFPGYVAYQHGGVEFNGKTYFGADNGVNGLELWTTDGTAAGTKMVIELTTGLTGSNIGPMLVHNGALYFMAKGAVYKTDGTAAGTVSLAKSYYALPNETAEPLFVYRGKVTFYAMLSSAYTSAFWTTDGTPAGTTQVGAVISNTSTRPEFIAVAGDRLYYQFNSNSNNNLYYYDSFATGPVSLGALAQTPHFTPFGAGNFAYVSGSGVVVRDASGSVIATYATGSVNDIEAFRGELYISVKEDSGKYSIKRLTPANTFERVSPLFSAWPAINLKGIGDRLFFFASSGGQGVEPWVTDGTINGTVSLGDLNPGNASSWVFSGDYYEGYQYHNSYFTAADDTGDLIYFQATTAANGTELFQTDGTAAGTKLALDFMPGTASGVPGPFLRTGGKLYAAANTPQYGREWIDVTPVSTTGRISGVIFNDANVNGNQDTGEAAVAGDVLYLDANANARLDAGEISVTATATGYTFDKLAAGVYVVRRLPTTDGRRQTSPYATGPAAIDITLADGQSLTGQRFGVTALPPTAVAANATVAEGSGVVLDGRQSSEPFGSIAAYAWDLNYDGVTFYTDATGPTPTFDASSIDGPATRTIALRVTDANGLVSAVATATVSVTNAAPTGSSFSSSYPTVPGQLALVGFGGSADPSPADKAAGLRFSFDFNNDGDFADPNDVSNSSQSSAAYAYLGAGTYTVRGRVSDKDGGFSDYTTSVLVNPVDPQIVTLEGESATFAGGTAAANGNAGFTGTGYADFAGTSSSAQWSLSRIAAGAVTLGFRYANGGTTDRPLAVSVNGTVIGTLSMPPTGSWTTWQTVMITASLAAGANTIKATAIASAGGANVDWLSIIRVTPTWLWPNSTAAYTLEGNTLTLTAGVVTLLSDVSATHTGLNVVVSSGAKVVSGSSQHLGSVTLEGTATATLNGPRGQLWHVTALTMSPSATLDLNESDLIIDYAADDPLPASIIPGLISTARNGGAWNGTGLTSSAAKSGSAQGMSLGYLTATEYKSIYGTSATFAGQVLDDSAVLIRLTVSGDTDLDRGVSINDFNRLASSFGVPNGKSWLDGDLDYDNGVSINDFNLLAANFGKTLPATAAAPFLRNGAASAKH